MRCGIPSHDTLNRVFRRLDPTQLEALLTNWGKEIIGLLTQKQLIVDGKQLRGTVETGHKQATVQILSVWAEKERLCLAQSQIADKTNEITAIPDLLNTLDITGSVVSIDAIGCQKTITKLIVDQQADYLISLKANQEGLYNQVVDWFERSKPCLQTDIRRDLGHGRAEKRTIMVSEKLDFIETAQE